MDHFMALELVWTWGCTEASRKRRNSKNGNETRWQHLRIKSLKARISGCCGCCLPTPTRVFVAVWVKLFPRISSLIFTLLLLTQVGIISHQLALKFSWFLFKLNYYFRLIFASQRSEIKMFLFSVLAAHFQADLRGNTYFAVYLVEREAKIYL